MKVGVMFANTMGFATPEGATTLAQAAEAAGFESVWTVEHVLWPEGYQSTYPYAETGRMPGDHRSVIPDPLSWLTYVGAKTETIKLATGILILPQRNPAVLAKEVATIDMLTGGRLMLGIGVGWLEEEFDALGVPFKGRGRRNDEYVDVMRNLWSAGDDGGASHDGEYVSFANVHSNPKPAGGTVPIHVGGHSRKAARRAGYLGDGFFPGTGDIPELLDIMRQAAADHGRDPAAVEVTAGHPGLFGDDPQAALEELDSWGVHRTHVPAFALARGDVAENCGMWAEKLGLG